MFAGVCPQKKGLKSSVEGNNDRKEQRRGEKSGREGEETREEKRQKGRERER